MNKIKTLAIAFGVMAFLPSVAMAEKCTVLISELTTEYNKPNGEKIVADLLNEPGGRWEKYNQFIVLYDTTGVAVGISPDHNYQGMDLSDLQSANGVYMFKEYLKLAQAGTGGKVPSVIEWADPASGSVIKLSGFASPLLKNKHVITCTELAS
ncbi:hypothetical protein ACFSM5_02895 [Lacibacterium aquatile]|uniref:Single Cache domain-containing protein n=1 Tax=Lacibacterium aquatile TaxID=1168082 RepID=A0ABW5DL17_9PROT